MQRRGIEMMTTQMGPEGFALLRPTRRPGGTGSNRGERLLGGLTSSSMLQSSSSSSFDANILEELREEDVWPPAADDDNTTTTTTTPMGGGGGGGDEKRRRFSQLNNISSNTSILSGLSVAFADPATRSHDLWRTRHRTSAASMIPHMGGTTPDGRRKPVVHQSAPLNVPDWSKILGIDNTNCIAGAADDEELEEEERLPPHEYLAREHARSQVAATSVLEGVGRTLKGRDLSRVRNAVWRQTGFLG